MRKVIIIIMEISIAPYLLNILQPKARTKAIQTTITSHTRTHTHTHTHTLTHVIIKELHATNIHIPKG